MISRGFPGWSRTLAGAMLLGLSVPVDAQVKVNVDRPAVRPAATAAKTIKLSTMLKSKVLIQQNESAGQIVDVMLSDGGCVEYFVASHDDQYYVIPYSAGVWREKDSVIFVDIAPAQFRKVQFFTNDQWPDLTAVAYRNSVFATFGVQGARNDGPRSTFKRDASGADVDVDKDPKNNPIRPKDRLEERKDNAKPLQPKVKDPIEDRKPGVPKAKDPTPRDRVPTNPGNIDPIPKPELDRKPLEKAPK
jgi:hypothetical protein